MKIAWKPKAMATIHEKKIRMTFPMKLQSQF